MKKIAKISFIIGLCCILVGGAIFTVAMSVAGWDFSVLNTLYTISYGNARG